VRNAEETRRRILAAALAEFAEKGIDGARVDRIAERAQTNKRMLYHYFGSKEGLYRAVLQQRLADRPVLGADDVAAVKRLVSVFAGMAATPQYVRLLMWEALERGDAPEAEAVRRDKLQHNVALVRAERVKRGRPTECDVDAGLLVLAELALATFPLAFPQITRMVTGLEPDSEDFARGYAALLETVGAAIDDMAPGALGPSRPRDL
jgi:AcrR family transcriptional regulator